MSRRILAFPDRVSSIRIRHHAELLVVPDELVDELFEGLIMAVVVSRAVDDEQVAFELMGEIDGRAFAVAIDVFFGRTHVAFLID